MKAPKTVFSCSECGYQSPKWLGRCPDCGNWNTMEEETSVPAKSTSAKVFREEPVRFSEMKSGDYPRRRSGIGELDRVLGGGIVPGSVVLLAGEPGIGKSTLLMQLCGAVAGAVRVLYVSGEESSAQLKMRADRLGVSAKELFILTETDIDAVMAGYDRVKPELLIIDSVQTMSSDRSQSVAGSISQVRECSSVIMAKAKGDGVPVILVGHVNKEGGIAGPKVLEHMVDAVLYFEGERQQTYRIIRAIKNRYGSTNEIGVFEMTDGGLDEVENPSEMLLAGRPRNTPGNCAVCTMEGTRPLIAEIQALVSPTSFPAPRRTSNGIDYNRLCLILAVLEKRLGLRFSTQDVYLNVIGGMRLDEPAADIAVAMALISSLTDRAVPDDLIAVGELGLSGECRTVSGLDHRVREAERLGFRRTVVPARNLEKRQIRTGMELLPIGSIFEVLKLLGTSSKEKQ